LNLGEGNSDLGGTCPLPNVEPPLVLKLYGAGFFLRKIYNCTISPSFPPPLFPPLPFLLPLPFPFYRGSGVSPLEKFLELEMLVGEF